MHMAPSIPTDLPHHPVLQSPWTYAVVSFSWQRELTSQHADTLELVLEKGGEMLRLLFAGVSEFEVANGFPWRSSGIQIKDASSDGMEDCRVWVSGLGQDPAMRFWARSVQRIDA